MVTKGESKASAQVSEGTSEELLHPHSFLKPPFAVTGRPVNARVHREGGGGVSEYRSIQFRSQYSSWSCPSADRTFSGR